MTEGNRNHTLSLNETEATTAISEVPCVDDTDKSPVNIALNKRLIHQNIIL